MLAAVRSLTEPAGLLPSSFARIVLPRAAPESPGRRCRRTRGVEPMTSSMVGYVFMSKIIHPEFAAKAGLPYWARALAGAAGRPGGAAPIAAGEAVRRADSPCPETRRPPP